MAQDDDIKSAKRRVRAAIAHRLGNRDPDVDDVLQASCLKMLKYERKNGVQARSRTALLRTIANRELANLLRKRTRERRVIQHHHHQEDVEGLTEHVFSQDQADDALIIEGNGPTFAPMIATIGVGKTADFLAALGLHLSDSEAKLIEYATLGLSQAKIAEARGVSRAAVNQQVRRVSERIQPILSSLKPDQIRAALELTSDDGDPDGNPGGEGPRRPPRGRKKGSGKNRSRDGPSTSGSPLVQFPRTKEVDMFDELRVVAALLAQEILALPAFREELQKQPSIRRVCLGAPLRHRVPGLSKQLQRSRQRLRLGLGATVPNSANSHLALERSSNASPVAAAVIKGEAVPRRLCSKKYRPSERRMISERRSKPS